MTGGRSPGGSSGSGSAGARAHPNTPPAGGCSRGEAVSLAADEQAARPDALALPDLASRAMRGSVVAASDEFFAEKENLIKPGAAVFSPSTFGHKGQVYDGWETRRRRGDAGGLPAADEHDWGLGRLGAARVVHAVGVDTAYFPGTFPQACSLEACDVPGYPDPDALAAARWLPIVPRSPLKGDPAHGVAVPARGRVLHGRVE